MKKNHLINQKGLTLIELLATLAISAMFIGLLSSILITSIKNNQLTQSHIDLRQEANVIVTKLRTLHHGLEDYELRYQKETSNIEIIVPEKTELLASDGVRLKGSVENSAGKKVLIENISSNDEVQQILESNSDENPLKINRDQPLLVTITLVDQNNKEFEIDTAIDGIVAYDPFPPDEDPEDDDDGEQEDENRWSLLDLIRKVLETVATSIGNFIGGFFDFIGDIWDWFWGRRH